MRAGNALLFSLCRFSMLLRFTPLRLIRQDIDFHYTLAFRRRFHAITLLRCHDISAMLL